MVAINSSNLKSRYSLMSSSRHAPLLSLLFLSSSLSSVMPEYRECIAHFLFLLWFLEYCQHKNLDLHVLGLWADKVKGKAVRNRKIPASKDLVFQLCNTSKDKRGRKGNQGFLWPPMWQKGSKNQDPPSINRLEWKDVRTTTRAIVLDFGVLHFQVGPNPFIFSMRLIVPQLAYLTHTSVQCFNKKTWENVVKQTPNSNRGYRIAIAFEFYDYVVAFLSIDNLVQVPFSFILIMPAMSLIKILASVG